MCKYVAETYQIFCEVKNEDNTYMESVMSTLNIFLTATVHTNACRKNACGSFLTHIWKLRVVMQNKIIQNLKWHDIKAGFSWYSGIWNDNNFSAWGYCKKITSPHFSHLWVRLPHLLKCAGGMSWQHRVTTLWVVKEVSVIKYWCTCVVEV